MLNKAYYIRMLCITVPLKIQAKLYDDLNFIHIENLNRLVTVCKQSEKRVLPYVFAIVLSLLKMKQQLTTYMDLLKYFTL